MIYVPFPRSISMISPRHTFLKLTFNMLFSVRVSRVPSQSPRGVRCLLKGCQVQETVYLGILWCPDNLQNCLPMSVCIDLTGKVPRVLHNCSICLELSETPYWLGCHVFCKSCISEWVLTSATCPTCRVRIPEGLVGELKSVFPRRSLRNSKATEMFTTDGVVSSTVSSREMMYRVENIN